ncbi:MAG: UvrD-helicase domain-containing protein [Firmicutes bacterium]|nr:UvrD-helicase domain-containing protein [Bacillota bacterium]
MFTKEQQQATSLRSADILVSAAAGSGKTTVMIQRIARLIDEGVKVDNILVCTFTKAAAQDMRLKAAKLLPDVDLPAQAFCTLHSFCNHLLKSYFYCLEIDPDYELMGEGVAAEERNKILTAVIKRQVADDPDFASIYEGMLRRRKDTAMRTALMDIYNTAVNTVDPREYFGRICYCDDDKSYGTHTITLAASQARALGRTAELLYLEYQEAKRKKALVDYNDLEHYTYQILSNSESADLIRTKYKYIFVDEYQDINPLQDALICKLAEGGNLFLVGDVKQSIYAFRGCEAKIFEDKYNDYATSKCAIELNANFRSSPDILNFVNSVFASVMTPEFGGVDYAQKAIMSGGKKTKSTLMPVEVKLATVKKNSSLKGVSEERSSSVYSVQNDDMRENQIFDSTHSESHLIADRIAELIDRQIVDETTGKLRQVKFDDIVVLMSSLTTLADTLLKVLAERQIPVALVGEHKVFETPIIKLLYNYLKVVDNFELDYELASIMRAPYFGGFDDDELATIRASHKEKDATFWQAVLESSMDKVKVFVDKIHRHTEDSRALSISELTSKITADFDLFSHAFGEGGDTAVKLSVYLDSLEAHQSRELYAYINFVDNAVPPKLESVAPSGHIRIMTMHKSKGLEFPCVITAGATREFNTRDLNKSVIADKDLGICCKAFDIVSKSIIDTPMHALAKESLRMRLASQNLRLWYVALTRAKYSLTVTGAVKGEEEFEGKNIENAYMAKCAYDWIRHQNIVTPAYVQDCQSDNSSDNNAPHIVRGVPSLGNPDPILTSYIQKAIDFVYKYDMTYPPKTSATKLMADEYAERQEDRIIYMSELIPDDDRGAERGIAYHRAMEYMWQKNTAIEESNVDPQKIQKCYDTLSKLIGDNRQVYTERNFVANLKLSDIIASLPSEYSLVQGVVDLIAVGKDDVIIVDYKTNNKPASVLAKQYAVQMRIYTQSAKSAFNKPIKAYIYSFFDDKLIECK